MKPTTPSCGEAQTDSRPYGLFIPLVVLVMCWIACRPNQTIGRDHDFALPQVRGGVFHLREKPAEPLLLAFLQTAPDTEDTESRRQAGFLLSMSHQYKPRGLRVAIVDSSALVTHKSPARDALINASYDWQLDIPLLEDEDTRVAKSWGVTRVPTLLLMAADGRVVERWEGFTGAASLAAGIEKACKEHEGTAAE